MKKLLFLLVIVGLGWYGYTNYWKPKREFKPADASAPAAGVCDFQSGDTITVVIDEDIPSPRCTRVRADQNLRIENETFGTIRVWFDNVSSALLFPSSVELKADSKYIFAKPFGEYLEPGVHILHVSLYGDSGAEIWLVK